MNNTLGNIRDATVGSVGPTYNQLVKPSPEVPKLELPAKLDKLDELINIQSELLNELLRRLSPIIIQKPPTCIDNAKEPIPVMTAVGTRLHDQINKINEQNSILQFIISCIQL